MSQQPEEREPETGPDTNPPEPAPSESGTPDPGETPNTTDAGGERDETPLLAALRKERETRKSLEKQLKDAASIRREAETMRHRLEQYRAAARNELPLDIAERLRGETPEELDADAEQLKQLLAPAPTTGLPNTTPGTNNTRPDLEALLRAATM